MADNLKENVKATETKAGTPKQPGLSHVRTTNAFKMINFELFTKPNKRVMGIGGFAFLFACGYIFYLRVTDEYKDVPTYTTLNDDGTLTRRLKKSKWD